eukprot:NODE_37_length_31305_cov_0.348939.p5 type:complete len:546 gc:universal NODE_37_length_31305_cov_0.348939:1890-253(-)
MNYITAYQKKKWKQHEIQRIYDNIPQSITTDINTTCPDHHSIVSSNIKLLSQWISTKKYSCFQVTLAFCNAAHQAHIQFNCITECLFETAIKRAHELDLLSTELAADSLPLRGIPFSCKDTFDVEGVDTSLGYGNKCFDPSKRNSAVVQGFLDLGAILICKTNVPQSLFATECSNNVFGYTLNPINPKYSPGGSSGGEACLLKCNGAAFGIGSDIAGSIRFPSGYCGVYGLRPTEARSINNKVRLLHGTPYIQVVMGPMARSVDDLQLLFKLMTCQVFFKLDPKAVPLLYQQVASKPLRIGYFIDTDFIKASPASHRGVLLATSKLQQHGHTTCLINIRNATEMFGNAMKLFTADGARNLINTNGDLPEKWLYLLICFILLPDFIIYILLFIAGIYNDPTLIVFLQNFYTKGAQELQDCDLLRKQHQSKFMTVMLENEFDVIICPISSTPAHLINKFDKCALGNYYSVVTSYLNMPVVAHPITTVESTDTWNAKCSNIGERNLKEYYDASVPLPVGIQIIALPFQEEMAIHVSKILDTAIEQVQR